VKWTIEKGFQLNTGPQNPSPSLQRFMGRIEAEYMELAQEVKNARLHEKDRQEWRFSQAGTYATYLDGKTTRICMTPEEGLPYTFTGIRSTTDGLYFTDSKKGPVGRITEKGSYRRHRHETGNVTADNLDFFPDRGDPALWRFVQAGKGFKAFIRRVPNVLAESLLKTPCA
jgi:hypothetical protein